MVHCLVKLQPNEKFVSKGLLSAMWYVQFMLGQTAALLLHSTLSIVIPWIAWKI
jgi:hypothetical protein